MFIGWISNETSKPITRERLLTQIEEATRNVHAPFFVTQVTNNVFNEEGLLFTSNKITQEEAQDIYKTLLEEKIPTSEQIQESFKKVEESMTILSVNPISIYIEPVWATVDENGEFPYVDIYDNQEEAQSKIGKEEEEGIVIKGIKQGWHIRGVETYVEQPKDFYNTYQEAELDLNRRILTSGPIRRV